MKEKAEVELKAMQWLKVLDPVPEKFDTKQSTGTGTKNIWKKYWYRYPLKFWVSSHTDLDISHSNLSWEKCI